MKWVKAVDGNMPQDGDVVLIAVAHMCKHCRCPEPEAYEAKIWMGDAINPPGSYTHWMSIKFPFKYKGWASTRK